MAPYPVQYNISYAVPHGERAPEPVMAEPKVGYWYHGESERGTGIIAQYQGWNEFTLGDGTPVNMTIYDHLVEQPKRT